MSDYETKADDGHINLDGVFERRASTISVIQYKRRFQETQERLWWAISDAHGAQLWLNPVDKLELAIGGAFSIRTYDEDNPAAWTQGIVIGLEQPRINDASPKGPAPYEASGGMNMFFYVRTQNPRPTFHLDMNADERAIMNRHVAFWSKAAENGVAIVFGPVMEPNGVYGIGVYQVQNEAELRGLIACDPANGLLKYDVLPMANAVVGNTRPL